MQQKKKKAVLKASKYTLCINYGWIFHVLLMQGDICLNYVPFKTELREVLI